MTRPSGRSAWLAAGLAWVFPGLGHFYLGRRRTAALFAVIVVSAFVLGILYQGKLYSHEADHPLTLLATFACFGAGILNIGARLLLDNPAGNILAPTFEFGCAFLLTAGMMNLLLMLDAWDIATGAKP